MKSKISTKFSININEISQKNSKYQINPNYAVFHDRRNGYLFDIVCNCIDIVSIELIELLQYFSKHKFRYCDFKTYILNKYNDKNCESLFEKLYKKNIIVDAHLRNTRAIQVKPIFNCKFFNLQQVLLKEGNFIFLGFPYEQSITNMGGTKFSSREIRSQSSSVFDCMNMSVSTIENVIINKNMINDIGDIKGIIFNRNGKEFDFLHNIIFSIITSRNIPIVIGGDHSISYATISGAAKARSIGIIHIDAHDDFYEFNMADWRNQLHHGNYLGGLVNIKSIKKIYSIGIRSFTKFVQKHRKITTIADKEILKRKILFDETIPYYVSFDVDIIDPLLITGVGTPVPLGYSIEEIVKLIEILTIRLDIIGIDIVEFIPNKKNETITIASLILKFIMGIQKKRLK